MKSFETYTSAMLYVRWAFFHKEEYIEEVSIECPYKQEYFDRYFKIIDRKDGLVKYVQTYPEDPEMDAVLELIRKVKGEFYEEEKKRKNSVGV